MTAPTLLAMIFGGTSALLFIALIISLRYNWRFAQIILYVEDSVEESLDVLDMSYNELSKLADKEIFFDSPEVRQAVGTIQASREAVLFVANTLASIDTNAIDSDEREA
ncbi:hypothetical protein HN588_01395 [Candidatus Bathyarchaeota archaeon]|jgi:hypothetical protein|nr:hypothetical protein [Candidatus Bathyarchaeota archaeon]